MDEFLVVVSGPDREFALGLLDQAAAEWVGARLVASYPKLSYRVVTRAEYPTRVGEKIDLRTTA